MISQNTILQDGAPVAVILDYKEYMNLLERLEDAEDYAEAVLVKQSQTEWTDHETLKRECGL